jgi:hypothetical protein
MLFTSEEVLLLQNETLDCLMPKWLFRLSLFYLLVNVSTYLNDKKFLLGSMSRTDKIFIFKKGKKEELKRLKVTGSFDKNFYFLVLVKLYTNPVGFEPTTLPSNISYGERRYHLSKSSLIALIIMLCKGPQGKNHLSVFLPSS